MKILLDYLEAHQRGSIINRQEYLDKYNLAKETEAIQPMKLLQGAPLIVNVDGTYVKLDDLPNLVCDRRYKKYVNDYVSCIHNNEPTMKDIDLTWRRP